MENQTNDLQSKRPKYWLSLEEWRQDPEFTRLAQSEFLSSPLSSEDGKDGWARREFLKLMGASLALTSFGCLRRPAQKIVPYVNRPQNVIPGLSNYYSSSFIDNGEALSVVVTTREGRPFKVEGNPDAPGAEGGMSARAHAHILSLYDPDRVTGPRQNILNDNKTNRETMNQIQWKDLDGDVVQALKEGGVALLTGSQMSPSVDRLVSEFSRAFGGQHYVWDNISYENIRRSQRLSYGSDVVPRHRWDKASYVLSINSDFLGADFDPVNANRQFSKSRDYKGKFSRLVVFESTMSATGMYADQRIKVQPSFQVDVVMAIIHQIVVKMGVSNYSGQSQLKNLLKEYEDVAATLSIQETINSVAKDLWAFKGESIVVGGGVSSQNSRSLELQMAINLLNSILGNDGKTIDYSNAPSRAYKGSTESLKRLVDDINAGKIKALIVQGTNPVYSAPSNLGFTEALKKVKKTVFVGDRINETGQVCEWVAGENHPMESWGDSETMKGIYAIQQPTITPLYDTRSFTGSMIHWLDKAGKKSVLGGAFDEYSYVRNFWKNRIYAGNRSGIASGNFEDFWVKLLQTGFFDTNSRKNNTSSGRSFKMANFVQQSLGRQPYGKMELVLYSTVGLRDGSLANVSWLQEFPDPVTKIVWDNYFMVDPSYAKENGIGEGDVLKVKVGEKTVQAPAHIQVGQSKNVIALAVGYGRSGAGKIADGVGINAFQFTQASKNGVQYAGLEATVTKTGKRIPLANVQGHHRMEGRQIVVEATLDQVRENPAANIHKHKIFSAWDKHKYPGHKWGMNIDLNSCTGCGACIIACQSENNIPVVGKKYVLEGREMHWIRVDRYYVGTDEDATAVNMPLVCQHCDNAPCETVCPVAATVHGDEGTNDMIYNRCVGTRYCANNCPYKVRRFNWFNLHKNMKSPMEMAFNPEVTVRARGVMEKCTFCKHRIVEAKQKARNEDVDFIASDVKTACQQSCPTNAITFGDMNDSQSPLGQKFADQRSYVLLEEFHAAPAVRYQTKIRNTDKLKVDPGHSKEGHHS